MCVAATATLATTPTATAAGWGAVSWYCSRILIAMRSAICMVHEYSNSCRIPGTIERIPVAFRFSFFT